MSDKNIILRLLDRRSWDQFPIGTKVFQYNNCCYVKIAHRQWEYTLSVEKTYEFPASDWQYIELPFSEDEVQKAYSRLFGEEVMKKGLKNCLHEEDKTQDVLTKCKHCGGWFCV